MLDGQASDLVPVLSRVPQGCLGTGPVLDFHDLPDNITSSVRIFADDYSLYRNNNSLTDCQILQDDLNALNDVTG